MNEQLKLLEERAGVATIKGRSFHAFRRTLTTALIDAVGLDAASAWIGDRPEVLLRAYLRTNQQNVGQAAAAITRLFSGPTTAKRLPHEEAPPSGALSGVSESDLATGPAGLGTDCRERERSGEVQEPGGDAKAATEVAA